MNSVGTALEAVQRALLSKEDKLLIEYGVKDEKGNWTEEGRKAIIELEAKDLGYNSIDHMNEKMGYEGARVSVLEIHDLIKKHEAKLVEVLTKTKAEEKKK